MCRAVVESRNAGPFDLPSFVIAYQPIVDVQNRSIVAYEALTRGSDGTPYPQLTANLSVDALRAFHRCTAEAAIRRAVELGIGGMRALLSINLQPDLHPDALDAAFIADVVRSCGLTPQDIVLEFTEDHHLSIPDYTRLLERNRDAGFTTAMDDFGAGYSGLSALVECRPEILKLDRALVKGIDTSDTRQKIVRAFASCSSALDMHLIAEGVETRAEYEMLMSLGITSMQGYLFSRPVVDALPTDSVWGVGSVEPARSYSHVLLGRLGFEAGLPGLILPA